MKILRRYFSKNNETNYKDVKVYLIGGTKKISELTDKQLKNVAAYDNLSKREKKNIIKNSIKFGIPMSAGGALIGANLSKNKKVGAVIGASIGASTMAGMAISGHKLHKRQATAAKKEIEYRKRNK